MIIFVELGQAERLTDPGNKLRNIAYGIVISPDTTLWPAVDSD